MPTLEHHRHRRRWHDIFTVWVGGVLLIGVVLGGWLPKECPVFRQWLSSCPGAPGDARNLTPAEQEDARVPHQVIEKDAIEFSAKAQDYRKTTKVLFSYKGDLTHQIAHLAVVVKGQYKRIALVTHPLVANLDWSRFSSSQPNETMYQRNETYASLDELRTNLPPAKEFAVDEELARDWNLRADQYTPLDPLTSLDGINYILTTYAPPIPDGTWRQYSQTFDTTEATPDKDGLIQWMIFVPDVKGGKVPFFLTTVHVDYQSLR